MYVCVHDEEVGSEDKSYFLNCGFSKENFEERPDHLLDSRGHSRSLFSLSHQQLALCTADKDHFHVVCSKWTFSLLDRRRGVKVRIECQFHEGKSGSGSGWWRW